MQDAPNMQSGNMQSGPDLSGLNFGALKALQERIDRRVSTSRCSLVQGYRSKREYCLKRGRSRCTGIACPRGLICFGWHRCMAERR